LVNPNPSNGFLTIKHPSTNKKAELHFYDMIGRKVKKIIPDRNSSRTDVMINEMVSGTYTLLWSDGSRVLSRIFIVSRE